MKASKSMAICASAMVLVNFGIAEGMQQVNVTNSDGSKYIGYVNAQKEPHGKGTETYPDGGKYVGDYKNGHPEGKGASTLGTV